MGDVDVCLSVVCVLPCETGEGDKSTFLHTAWFAWELSK